MISLRPSSWHLLILPNRSSLSSAHECLLQIPQEKNAGALGLPRALTRIGVCIREHSSACPRVCKTRVREHCVFLSSGISGRAARPLPRPVPNPFHFGSYVGMTPTVTSRIRKLHVEKRPKINLFLRLPEATGHPVRRCAPLVRHSVLSHSRKERRETVRREQRPPTSGRLLKRKRTPERARVRSRTDTRTHVAPDRARATRTEQKERARTKVVEGNDSENLRDVTISRDLSGARRDHSALASRSIAEGKIKDSPSDAAAVESSSDPRYRGEPTEFLLAASLSLRRSELTHAYRFCLCLSPGPR